MFYEYDLSFSVFLILFVWQSNGTGYYVFGVHCLEWNENKH